MTDPSEHPPRASLSEQPRPLLGAWRPLLIAFVALQLLAGVLLYGLSEDTGRLFAWTIAPALSAAFLGAGYFAALVLVVLAMREPRWERARLGLVAIWVFSALTLVATLAHLDAFHFDDAPALATAAAWLWLVVYVAVPVAMTVVLIRQWRTPGAEPPVRTPIPGALAVLLAAKGGALLALGGALLVDPGWVDRAWPWDLTPLVGRALAGWYLALGAASLLAIAERDLDRLRAAGVTYAVFGLLQAGALARFVDDVDWDRPAAWVYLGFLALITGIGGYGALARRGVVAAPAG